MQKFMERFKKQWSEFPAEKKRKFVILAAGLSIIIIGLLGYVVSHRGTEAPKRPEVAKTEEIKLEGKMLEKTQLAETQKQLAEMRKQIEELQKQREEAEKKAKEMEEKEKQQQQQKEREKQFIKSAPQVPPPLPPGQPAQGQYTMPQGQVKPPEPPKPELVGGIGMVKQEPQKKEEAKKDTATTKKKTYYLPPSFMEATLLSGLDAPAVSKAEGNPVPALFRIKAPAVLPNQVKANLKGCFVIAEGLGSLADERAHLRLVNISCIDRKGNAVIDQKVKGFVVDSDGKIGLRGKVVSKMGAVLARSLIAGLFGGLGQVMGTGAYTYTVTGAGTVSTLEHGKTAQTVIGSGIAQAANELQRFYLDLARQTIPVVEIQATRTVTLVVSEGVELEIKSYNLKD